MAASAEVPIRLSVNISLLIAGDFFWNCLLQIWNYKEILILCMETPQAKSTLYLTNHMSVDGFKNLCQHKTCNLFL